jgi:ABC-type proline/glycine betaine transport system permease subunit
MVICCFCWAGGVSAVVVVVVPSLVGVDGIGTARPTGISSDRAGCEVEARFTLAKCVR